MNAMLGSKSSIIAIHNLSSFFSSYHPNTTFLHLWNRASTTHSFSNILQSVASTASLVFLLRHFVDHFTVSLPPCTLVNQAFAVAVGNVLEGYISALHTIHASLILRRASSKPLDCFNTVAHSEITLLELYLHTKQLRIQIQALASICNLQKWAHYTDFQDVIAKATSEFADFYRGGSLLTFLYHQLQVCIYKYR
jgi:gamma-tubulin complex component 6